MYSYKQIKHQEKIDNATKIILKIASGVLMPIHITLAPITYTIKEIVRRKTAHGNQIPYTTFNQYVLEPFSGNRIDTYIDHRPTSAKSMRKAMADFDEKCAQQRELAGILALKAAEERARAAYIAKITTTDVINVRESLKNSQYIIVEPDRAGRCMIINDKINLIFINGTAMDPVIDFHGMGHRMGCSMIVMKDDLGNRYVLNDEQIPLVINDISNAILAYQARISQNQK